MTAINSATTPIEYRFNYAPARGTCPSCGREFESSIGMWPHLATTGESVCGRKRCPSADTVAGPLPCDTLVEFAELEPATIAALRATGGAVAEQFRAVSLGDDVPEHDRKLLQLAAIDLQYCQADDTRIEAYEPRLMLRTCGEAAAELLLSGCAGIIESTPPVSPRPRA
jgi:hypothetical protein